MLTAAVGGTALGVVIGLSKMRGISSTEDDDDAGGRGEGECNVDGSGGSGGGGGGGGDPCSLTTAAAGDDSQQQQQQPWWKRRRRALLAAAGLAAAVGLALVATPGAGERARRRWRRWRRKRNKAAAGEAGRIPLPDLVRFKERQWFLEELENSRDGDPNAMLRLAKMYLHGQGTPQSASLAAEWLRRARGLGAGGATLDELYATDEPDPRGKLQRLLISEERRRAARRAAAGIVPGDGGGRVVGAAAARGAR